MHLASKTFKESTEPKGSVTALCVNVRFFDWDGRYFAVLDAYEINGRQVSHLSIPSVLIQLEQN